MQPGHPFTFWKCVPPIRFSATTALSLLPTLGDLVVSETFTRELCSLILSSEVSQHPLEMLNVPVMEKILGSS